MKRFLLHTLLLSLVALLLLILSLFFIKDNVAQSSILGALPNKHLLLKHTLSPKIILLGGSNVSFGMDSKTLSNGLHKPVVNMGIHASLGLYYIINDIKPYINKGDTIILIPEYEHFYTDNFYGELELISVMFDIEPSAKSLLTTLQWKHLLKYLPTYAAKKIKNYVSFLFKKKTEHVDIYHKNSFNSFGDAYLHWDLPNQQYTSAPINKGTELVNTEVINFLKDFKLVVKSKGAILLIFPPVIDEPSYNHQQKIIEDITQLLQKAHLEFLAKPISYKYDTSFFFNSYYHLNKKGVDKRTNQILSDIRNLKK